MKILRLLLLVATLAGCATGAVTLTPAHPANPEAPEAPLPTRSETLAPSVDAGVEAPEEAKDADQPPAQGARWQCPMHSQIVQDAPGECPICGMSLVPIEPPR